MRTRPSPNREIKILNWVAGYPRRLPVATLAVGVWSLASTATAQVFNNPASWATYDFGDHCTPGVDCTDPDGYSGGVFDGRYVYFAPHGGDNSLHAEVLRYDTTCNFSSAACWATCTPTGANSGFHGAVFDGQFVYFVPYGGAGENGKVLRYNTVLPFCGAPSSWETFDAKSVLGAKGGYIGGTFDGRYVYFAPHAVPGSDYHGEVLRYDTTLSFGTSASWEKYDAESGIGAKGGYAGAVVAIDYIYFVPFASGQAALHGEVLRYNRTLSFTQASSWEKYDFGDHCVPGVNCTDPDGYSGGVFDGRYVYFAPDNNGTARHGEVLRFDTTQSFGAAASWATYDFGAHCTPGITCTDPDGYVGVAFDGRYLYFAPWHNGTENHGEVLRYDTTQSFATAASWETYDFGADCTLGLNCTDPDGYFGVVSDGHYLYFIPYHNGTEPHGEVLRYDTLNSASIPAVSSWGVAALLLLLVTAATVVLIRVRGNVPADGPPTGATEAARPLPTSAEAATFSMCRTSSSQSSFPKAHR